MKWSTACHDWERRIVDKESMVACPVMFPEYAEYALGILKELQIVDVPGRPKIGDITRDWVYDFANVIFGSYDESKNRRLIQEFFLLISKKNTKSTTAAALMLTALIVNARESAEFLILAPTVEVANNSFDPVRDMIRVNPELESLFQVQEHIRTVTHRITKAKLKVVAAESDAVSGKKATGILIDELWLFGKKSNAANMINEATGGLASRPEGFVIYLTTQSDEPPAGVFREKLMYARKVRDGEVDDNQFLPVIYEYPKSMLDAKDYLKPENWYITNPNLGASVDEVFLRRKMKSAEEGGPEVMASVLAKHLNVEIGLALRSDRWAGADFWQESADKSLTLDSLMDRSEVIDIGIDGGGLDDLLGLCVLGREENTGRWLAWHHAWAHPSALERRKSEAPRFLDFAKQKDLTIVDRIGEDVDQVADICFRVWESDLLDKIGVDPIGIGAILDALEEREISKDKIIGVSISGSRRLIRLVAR